MANENIKRELKNAAIPFWMVADQVGISECTLSRWFRHELAGERLEQVRKAIDEIVNTREQERS